MVRYIHALTFNGSTPGDNMKNIGVAGPASA